MRHTIVMYETYNNSKIRRILLYDTYNIVVYINTTINWEKVVVVVYSHTIKGL